MSDITIGLGEGVSVPLSKAPHILVGGMTGSGKSVVMHSIIRQLLSYPKTALLVLIDPKRVEFGQYRGSQHLAWPDIASAPGDVEMALRWAESEMQARFWRMEQQRVQNVDQMAQPWARLVIFVDELANLVLANKALEQLIVSIASMGRAAGVHLVLATQRPSADVITGLIRANVPTRICLPVITKVESRIILDVGGGELLEKPGDMLVRLPGRRDLIRTRSVMR